MSCFVINPFVFASAGGGWDGLAHRYWRIHSTANGGATHTTIVELEMYEAEFGPNVCGSGTASASSFVSAATPYTADRAFDGSLQDRVAPGSAQQDMWVGQTNNEWLAYDFGVGNAKSIVAIGMHGQTSPPSEMPTTFSVDYSDDGSTWTTAWSETSISWAGREFKRFVNPATSTSYSGSPWGAHVYWRLIIQSAQDNTTSPALAEIEMRATPSGSDQCSGGTASASSSFSGSFPASNAFDNNVSTLWSAGNTVDGQNAPWLQYQFASAVHVAELVLTGRNDGFAQTSPIAFALQYADASTGPWTTALAGNSLPTWSVGESRTYTDPNYI